MDYSLNLQRQRSCSCVPVDVGSWGNNWLSGGFSRQPRYSDDCYGDGEDEFDTTDYDRSNRSLGTRCRGLWRRIVREKRKILNKSAAPVRVPYDPYTYAQNFDEGSAWVEPENLSRSFSARFAAPPSRILQRFA